MGTFTMPLHEVLDYTTDIGLNEYELHAPLVALYPDYRDKLNKKIIDHYLNCEIGMETIEMFRLAVRRRLNEQMPIINQMYASTLLDIKPLLTVDIANSQATDGTATASSTADSNSSSTSKARAVSSEFPQTMLSDDGEYASDGQDTISNTTATANSGDNSTTSQNASVDGTTKGFQGSQAMLLMQYRQSFVNVDMMVIESLSDCFMSVWSNGDEFTTGGNYYGYGFGYGFGLRFF
jgi:hypothetical protein